MRRRRQACDWQHCGVQAVGYRQHWQLNVLRRFWFCRPHQRWWDRGVRRQRRHYATGPDE